MSRGTRARRVALVLLLVPTAAALCGAGAGRIATYIVPSESMKPAFQAGQRITIDLDAYEAARPTIGDAIVFHPPKGAISGKCGVSVRPSELCRKPTPRLSSQKFLKRLVATPGDRLSIRNGRPVVNGSTVLADLIQRCYHGCSMRRAITIPPDHYFVLGDNSRESSDSRFWGPVPSDAIIGRVIDEVSP